jgi:acyl-coenzyme A thioesterase PaaI-like protein
MRSPADRAAPGAQLLRQWRRLAPLPFGKQLFSWAVGRTAPYTGTVGGVYDEVRPGYARTTLRDRRGVRNHLASVHAVALVNLAEMTSGVALLTALPPGVRGIVTGLSIVYRKKARGRLRCETHAAPATPITQTTDQAVVATITDGAGDVVAECTVQWRLSPAKPMDTPSTESA